MNYKSGFSIRLMESETGHRSQQASNELLCVEAANNIICHHLHIKIRNHSKSVRRVVWLLYVFRSMGIDPNWFFKVFVGAVRVYGYRPVDLVERGNELPVPIGFFIATDSLPPRMFRTADNSIPHQVVRHRGGRGSRAPSTRSSCKPCKDSGG